MWPPPENTVVAATVNAQETLASSPGLFAGEPANTVAAATVNAQKTLASSPGLFAGKPAPTPAEVHAPPVPNPRYVAIPNQCRSGFTREYGGSCNGECPENTGQQPRPLRG